MKKTWRLLAVLGALLGCAATLGAQEVLRQTGSLDSGDRTLPDGRYVDWLRLNATAGTRYYVSVDADDLDPAVILRFADGGSMENDDLDGWSAGIVYASPRAESIEIGVTTSSEPETGSYTALVRRLSAAKAVQSGQTVSAQLGAAAGEPVHIDSYILTGAKGDRVRLGLVSDDFDPQLRLQVRGGYVDEGNDTGEGTGAALTYLFLEAGQLEIQVRGSDIDDSGSYQLVADRRPAARTLETGKPLTGRLSDDTEEFLLEGKRGQAYVVEASSEDFDTLLTVTDRIGRKAKNDDHGGGTDSLINYLFGSDGAVAVTVARLESGDSAPFRVSVTPSSVKSDAFRNPEGQLEDGHSYRGYLDVGAGRAGDKYTHRFTFQGAENELVRLELMSEDFDAYLEVTGPDGSEFSDDDGGEDYNSRLEVVCSRPGLYQVSATSASDWNIGFYELTFERAGQVSPELDREGALERRDERDPSGRYFDVYTLSLEDGDSMTVDMTSEDFDAYLYVWSPDGETIESDDDGGGDTQSRVQIRDAQSGVWTIYATSASSAEMGSYQLRVSRY